MGRCERTTPPDHDHGRTAGSGTPSGAGGCPRRVRARAARGAPRMGRCGARHSVRGPDLGRGGGCALARSARPRDHRHAGESPTGSRSQPRRRAAGTTSPRSPSSIFGGLDSLAGARGLQVAQVAAVAIACGLIARDARRLGAGDRSTLVVLLLVIPAAFAAIVAVRAQLFSLALFPLLAAAVARRGAPAVAPDLARPAAPGPLVEPARRRAHRARGRAARTCCSIARGASRSSPGACWPRRSPRSA